MQAIAKFVASAIAIVALFVLPTHGTKEQLLKAVHDQVKTTIDTNLVTSCPTTGGKKLRILCSYRETLGEFQGVFCHGEQATPTTKKVTMQTLLTAIIDNLIKANSKYNTVLLLELIQKMLSADLMKLCPKNPGGTVLGNTFTKEYASSDVIATDAKAFVAQTADGIHSKTGKTYDEVNLDNLLFPPTSEPTKNADKAKEALNQH